METGLNYYLYKQWGCDNVMSSMSATHALPCSELMRCTQSSDENPGVNLRVSLGYEELELAPLQRRLLKPDSHLAIEVYTPSARSRISRWDRVLIRGMTGDHN